MSAPEAISPPTTGVGDDAAATGSIAGRSRERFRRAALSTVAAVLARSISLAGTALIVPAALSTLGPERYGIWATLTTFVTLISIADLGLGYGLLNAVAQANGRDDRLAARHSVSSAFVLLIAIAVGLGLLAAVSYPFVNWGALYNVSSAAAASDAGPATLAFIGPFLVALPLSVSQRIRQGEQEGFKASLFDAAGAVIGLVVSYVAIRARAPLWCMVLGVMGGPALGELVHSCVLFGRDRPWLRPSLAHASATEVRRLLRQGMVFCVLQVTAIVSFSMDRVIIAQRVSLLAVSAYDPIARVATLPASAFELLVNPLWPAYAEAHARGDRAWTIRTLRRSLLGVAILACLAAVLLVLLAPWLLHLWLPAQTTPPTALLIGFGVWLVCSALGTTVAMFYNGTGLLRIQLICALFLAPVSLTAKLLSAPAFGISAIPWAMALSYLACVIAPQAVLLGRILRERD